MPIYNGYERKIPPEVILQNELEAYTELVRQHPDNSYFKARLVNAQKSLAVHDSPPFKGGANNPTRKVTNG